MDDLIQALRDALGPSADIQIDVLGNSNRIGGLIIWDGFDELSQRERQKLVWDIIRTQPAQLQLQMAPVITLTNSEVLVNAA